MLNINRMETNKIPMADDFMNFDYLESNEVDFPSYESIKKQMIEFAKMHVKKQQEEIISKVTANGNIRTDLIDFIPKCYPLENIK